MIRRTLLSLLFILTVACNRNSANPAITPSPSPIPTATPTPTQIVQQAADHLQSLDGFHFRIARSGAPAYIDPDNTLVFGRADGDFVTPATAQATVRVLIPGFATQLNIIAIGNEQWQTNPATGEWEVLPPELSFNPSILFDNSVGLPAILNNDLTNLIDNGFERNLDGLEDIGNLDLQHFTATLDGTTLSQISGGLISATTMQLDLWLDPATNNIYRITLTEPIPEGEEDRIWQVDLSQFNQTVTIVPPI